jgi:hypothetical protein
MYRTTEMDSSTISIEMDKKLQEERKSRRQVVTMQKSAGTGRKKLRELVKSRMKNLGMDEDDYGRIFYSQKSQSPKMFAKSAFLIGFKSLKKCRRKSELLIFLAINDSRKTLSYVIINPSYDLELEAGDIV